MRKFAWVFVVVAVLLGAAAASAVLIRHDEVASQTGSVADGPLGGLPSTTVLAYALDTSLTTSQAMDLSWLNSVPPASLTELVKAPAAATLTEQPWVLPGVAVGYVTAPSGEGWVGAVNVSDTLAASQWAEELNKTNSGWAVLSGSTLRLASSPTAIADGPPLAQAAPYVLEWVPEGAVAAAYVNMSSFANTTWVGIEYPSTAWNILSTLTEYGVTSALSSGQVLIGVTPSERGLEVSGTGTGVRVDGATLPAPGDVSDAARSPQGSGWVITAANVAAVGQAGAFPATLGQAWTSLITSSNLPPAAANDILGTQATLAYGPSPAFADVDAVYGFRSRTTDSTVAANAASVLAYLNVLPGGAWSVQVDDTSIVAATSPTWLATLAANQPRPDLARFPGADSTTPTSARVLLDGVVLRASDEATVWDLFGTAVLDLNAAANDTVTITGVITPTSE